MPEKAVVVYTSRYGSTRRYAEWIAAEIGADLFAAKELSPKALGQYDVVVYGGGLYAGGIAGVKLVTQNICNSLVVFTVGLADPDSTDYSTIINKNFTAELLSKTKLFHLRGGIDYKQLGPVHRTMMALMKAAILKKPESKRDSEDKEFLETYNRAVNFEDKRTIDSIVDYVRGL